jgi:hypothetical protein
MDPGAVRDEYASDLIVVYTYGPQFGRRVVTHADLEQMHMPASALRRSAFEHLEVLSSRAEFHGQPPALMLSFEGLESSLLLANDFWNRLKGVVPGELVVGVPARDVVIVTGSQSKVGLEKARRCVERVFMAGDEHLLSRGLLVRRGNAWEPFDRPARPAARPAFGPNHHHGNSQPPRQYQDHPSWPGERVPVTPPRGPARPATPTPSPVPSPRPAAAGLGTSGAPLPFPAQPSTTGSLPRQRPGARPDNAPYSSMPYSSLPYSAMPYSAVPYSGAPYSAPYPTRGAGRHSQPQDTGYQAPSYRPAAEPKPAYRDELYSTGSHAAPLYPASAPPSRPASAPPSYPASAPQYPASGSPLYPASASSLYPASGSPLYPASAPPLSPSDEPAQPAYPESWGWLPEQTTTRSDRPLSPRARFSR